jgi:predicted site-specific integrase-resolvase
VELVWSVMDDHTLIRTSEAARRLGVTSQYLRLLEAEGKVPSVRRVLGYRCFTDEDVARLRAMGVGSGERLKPYEEVAGRG